MEGSTPMWESQSRSSHPSSHGLSRAEQKNSYMAHLRVRASRLPLSLAAAGPSCPSPGNRVGLSQCLAESRCRVMDLRAWCGSQCLVGSGWRVVDLGV